MKLQICSVLALLLISISTLASDTKQTLKRDPWLFAGGTALVGGGSGLLAWHMNALKKYDKLVDSWKKQGLRYPFTPSRIPSLISATMTAAGLHTLYRWYTSNLQPNINYYPTKK